MKKYSILIVGLKCYYGHLIEFITNLKKKNPLVDITLATSSIPQKVHDELSPYVTQIVEHKSFNKRWMPRFVSSWINALSCRLLFSNLHRRCHFDVVDIHFANPFVKHVLPVFKKMTKNIVITPWGSDVLRVEDESAIRDMRDIYAQARYVTVGQDSPTGKCAIEKFKVDPNKMVQLGWGGELFDYIHDNSINVDVEDAKARFGLAGRYVITCGYNTQKSQRHEVIIDAINEVKDRLPENLTVLIPRTYVVYKGKTNDKDQYVDALKEKCKVLGLNLKVVEEHLDLADLLKLRMATDIFVHIQVTDAGSRSVMEYVACNKKVVHGSWVKYAYLEDYKPSCYYPVEHLEQLGACIVKAYHGQLEELPQEVWNVILERGWNYKMGLWNEFFESLV